MGTQTLDDTLVECPCHMAGADLRGLIHYRMRGWLPEALQNADQAVISAWILKQEEVDDAHRDGWDFKPGRTKAWYAALGAFLKEHGIEEKPNDQNTD